MAVAIDSLLLVKDMVRGEEVGEEGIGDRSARGLQAASKLGRHI